LIKILFLNFYLIINFISTSASTTSTNRR